MKDVESIARAATKVRHWASLPGPGAQDAHTTIAFAPPSARSMNCCGKRMH